MSNNKHIILFDGECTFCSFWVKFILKRDKNDAFRFASLQSDIAKQLIEIYHIDKRIDSVVLIDNKEKVFTKSNAVIEILYLLGGIKKLFYGLKIFPRFLRDFVYDIVAKMRYKFFKRKICELPLNTNYKTKFL